MKNIKARQVSKLAKRTEKPVSSWGGPRPGSGRPRGMPSPGSGRKPSAVKLAIGQRFVATLAGGVGDMESRQTFELTQVERGRFVLTQVGGPTETTALTMTMTLDEEGAA